MEYAWELWENFCLFLNIKKYISCYFYYNKWLCDISWLVCNIFAKSTIVVSLQRVSTALCCRELWVWKKNACLRSHWRIFCYVCFPRAVARGFWPGCFWCKLSPVTRACVAHVILPRRNSNYALWNGNSPGYVRMRR